MSNNIVSFDSQEEEKEEPFSNFRVSNKPNQKKRLIFIIIAVTIIIFIISFISIYYFFFDSDENSSDKINEINLKYEVNNTYNNIKLFDTTVVNIMNSIESMTINDEDIKPVVDKYKFKKTGIHNIKIKFKNNLNSLESLFKNCANLIEVDFSKFDFNKINNLSNLFFSCSSLIKVNGLSSKFESHKT